MPRPKKPPLTHLDKFGQIIATGNKVAVAHHNRLRVCNVERITPKRIHLKPVNLISTSRWDCFQASPEEAIVVEGLDILSFILKGKIG
jgi:hypothetical protein